jgi:hypothetical protein
VKGATLRLWCVVTLLPFPRGAVFAADRSDGASRRGSEAGSGWTAPRFEVYEDGLGHWWSVDAHTHDVRKVQLPAGRVIRGVAVAPDGRVVMTADEPSAHNTLLFIWDPGAPMKPPVSIGDVRGHHFEPAVSLDGQWVYFAHNPDSSGPPGAHSQGAFAQIYRVHLDGSGLEALTANAGCHWGPTAVNEDLVVLIHSSCSRGQWVETLRKGVAAAEIVSPRLGLLQSVELAPDRSRILIESSSLSETFVEERELRTGHVERLFSRPREFLHARYGRDRRDVLFQSQNAIWAWTHGGTDKLATFSEETE